MHISIYHPPVTRTRRRSRLRRGCRTALASIAMLAAVPAFAATYYVNPAGSDGNAGTSVAPWKTFYHAAQVLQAGDTAIFADGTYTETQRVIIGRSGTASAPIVFRAQSPRGAKIVFQGLQTAWGKIFTQKSYITIQGFDITEDAKGSTTSDVLVNFDNFDTSAPTQGNRVIGNVLHGAYFNALKVYKSDNFLADGNVIYDTNALAFDVINTYNTVFRSNYIYDVTGADPVGPAAILAKGGVRSAQFYDNVIRVRAGHTLTSAMILGGQSSAHAVYDASSSGYEAYNSVLYNNVVIAEDIGSLQYGLRLMGARDCGLFGNVVVGAVWSIFTSKSSGDASNGWAWDPLVRNPLVRNNIVLDAVYSITHGTIWFGDIEGSVSNDYNLYYNSSTPQSFPPNEAHGVYADPMFVDKLNDWHVRSGSATIGHGQPQSFSGFLGEPIDVSMDAAGMARPTATAWTIGAYEAVPTGPAVAIAQPTGGTVSGSVSVAVNATDAVAALARVDLRQNGVTVGSSTVAPYQFNWDSTKVPNGSVSLTAAAFDAAGNSQVSAPVSVNVSNTTPDTVAPSVTITNPLNGSRVKGAVTITTSVADNAGAAGIKQVLYIDGVLRSSVIGTPLSYSWQTNKSAPGTHVIKVVASDMAGNASTAQVQVTK